MFSKKSLCPRCDSRLKETFDFCPYCGIDLRNPERELRDYGMIGKHESSAMPANPSMGISDKLIGSIFNSLIKSLESQMKGMDAPEIQSLPNGIQIKMSPAPKKQNVKKRTVTEDQVKRMSHLPRAEAKTDVRRLSDRIIYEIKASGVTSVDDVFVSKVESGYEVKAIGKNKVYVNSLQVDLPLKSYSVTENGLVVEFGLQ